MFKYSLDTDDILFKSVMHYVVKFIETNNDLVQ